MTNWTAPIYFIALSKGIQNDSGQQFQNHFKRKYILWKNNDTILSFFTLSFYHCSKSKSILGFLLLILTYKRM